MHLLMHHRHSLAIIAGDCRQLVLVEQEARELVVFLPTDLVEREPRLGHAGQEHPGDDFRCVARRDGLFRPVFAECTALDLLVIGEGVPAHGYLP